MPMFRKKPVVIEASQWFKNGDHPKDGEEVFESGEFRGQRFEGEVVRYFRRPDVDGDKGCQHCGHIMNVHGWIDTLEGGHIVCPSDWVITGVKGERYPCKADIFAETYESAERGPVNWKGEPTTLEAMDAEMGYKPAVGRDDGADPVMTPEQVAAAREMFRQMPEGVNQFDPGPAAGALDGEFEEDEALTDIYFRMRADMNRLYDRAMGMEKRLKAEGEHTAAANAEIDRLKDVREGSTPLVLACDVMLPPHTIIRKGCSWLTLLAALRARERDPLNCPHFAPSSSEPELLDGKTQST